jgi:glyoxylase-like metal-dependent hydrolase (beta-lactamase superfamily II)
MKMYAFHCGGEKTLRSVLDPFDEHCGDTIQPPYFCYLVQHPEQNVLYDTAAHPSLAVDPRARLGAAADLYDITVEPGDDIVSRMETVGIKPEDVAHVVQSHLHYDHAGGLEFFPDSTVYVGQGELAFAHWPPVYQREVFVRADFDHPLHWKELKEDYDVFNDGSVVVFPTPGHTPGHQSMLVKGKERAYILTGDAAYDEGKMRDRCLPGLLWNPDALVESWERIEEMQRRHNAELIVTHDLHFEKNIRIAPDEWYE